MIKRSLDSGRGPTCCIQQLTTDCVCEPRLVAAQSIVEMYREAGVDVYTMTCNIKLCETYWTAGSTVQDCDPATCCTAVDAASYL